MSLADRGDDWGDAFRASAVVDLLAALAGCDADEILGLLQKRYAGVDSDDLEQIITETEHIPELLQRRHANAGSDELQRMLREEDATLVRKLWSWPV